MTKIPPLAYAIGGRVVPVLGFADEQGRVFHRPPQAETRSSADQQKEEKLLARLCRKFSFRER